MNWQFSLNSLLLTIIACCLIVLVVFKITSRKDKSHEAGNKYQPNIQAAIRDVLIASLQKGQLPTAILGVMLIILSLRIPAKEITSLLSETVHIFYHTAALGWTFSLFILIISLMTAVMRSKKHTSQMAVLEKEKSLLIERIQIQTDEIKRLSAANTKNKKP